MPLCLSPPLVSSLFISSFSSYLVRVSVSLFLLSLYCFFFSSCPQSIKLFLTTLCQSSLIASFFPPMFLHRLIFIPHLLFIAFLSSFFFFFFCCLSLNLFLCISMSASFSTLIFHCFPATLTSLYFHFFNTPLSSRLNL